MNYQRLTKVENRIIASPLFVGSNPIKVLLTECSSSDF